MEEPGFLSCKDEIINHSSSLRFWRWFLQEIKIAQPQMQPNLCTRQVSDLSVAPSTSERSGKTCPSGTAASHIVLNGRVIKLKQDVILRLPARISPLFTNILLKRENVERRGRWGKRGRASAECAFRPILMNKSAWDLPPKTLCVMIHSLCIYGNISNFSQD